MSDYRQTGDAAPEYQVLVNDLQNLERILAQINELRPAEHDLIQLDPIRATIKACQLPLQNFLDKISKFDDLLGVWAFKGRSLNGIGRRIQWKVAYKSDVKELRATLAGYVDVLTLHLVLQSLKSTLAAETDRASNLQTVHSEIEAQRAILESLDRRQLDETNNTFNIEAAFSALIERFDQSTTLDADMQTNLVDQTKFLQSIESTSQTIHLGQGEMLRNLRSELERIKQHGAPNFAPHATFKPAYPGQPSSKLTTSLKALAIFLAGSTAALAYGSTIKPTVMSHAPVRPSFRPPMPNDDSKIPNHYLIHKHVGQSAKDGLDFLSLDQHSDQQSPLRFLRGKDLKEHPSAVTFVEDGGPSDMLQCSQSGTDNTPSSNVTPLEGGQASDRRIPPHLSFIVKLEPVSPDYGDGQIPRQTEEGFFLPPDKRNGLREGGGPALLLRWIGGRLSHLAANDLIRRVILGIYRTATVFTQYYDTAHLLAVPFDAREQNVRDTVIGWRRLSFNHERISDTDKYYSYVSCVGAEPVIAASGSAHWMPQLLPVCYSPRKLRNRIQAGLIGNIPLLIALAAFSTPPTALGVLEASVQPGAWIPHKNPYPSGHVPERGMVVTVYLDPRNPHHSVKESLDKLQKGEYGPFYGPTGPPPSVPSRPSWIKQFETYHRGASTIPSRKGPTPQADWVMA